MLTAKFLNLFANHHWAIELGAWRALISRLPGMLAAIPMSPVAAVSPSIAAHGKIGVLRMSGPIVKGIDPALAEYFGLCSVDKVHRAADLVAERGITHLVLDLDTPGGMVLGLAEAADRLLNLREVGVTLTAYSETWACSAGYYLGAACNEFVAAPSAIIGSVGTIIEGTDDSKLWERIGLKPEYFVTEGSEAKLFGAMGLPWSDEAKSFFQGIVNARGAEFKDFVSQHRPGIAREDMNGMYWAASDAPAGYVDHTHANGRPISTLGDLLSILTL